MFDPFEALGIEKTYAINLDLLEKAYFEAQKKMHPDRFVTASAEEKGKAIEVSTSLNQAYLLLKDPLKRAHYMLEAEGVEPLSHHGETLAQTMGWREAMAEGKDLRPELSALWKSLIKQIEQDFEQRNYEGARLAFYRLTYIQKLLQEIEGRRHGE